MIAHFFLLAESFAHNSDYSKEEIEEKVKQLAMDIQLINEYKETNKLYTNYEDLYPQIFYGRFTLQEFICNPLEVKKGGFDRDVVNAIQTIIQKSEETTITSKEVIDGLLSWEDADNCHGLIAFHIVDGIPDTHQVIYGIDGWYKFRRYFLGKYPKDGGFFIEECKKYFVKLFFHERNKKTIRTILDDFSQRIIYHLSALNDKFHESRIEGLNRTEVLEHFSTNTRLNKKASLQGNAKKKKDLTFDFIYNDSSNPANSKIVKVCCEPHLKLCRNDNYPVDTSYHKNKRIYFHEGMKGVENSKILIGHIGIHL